LGHLEVPGAFESTPSTEGISSFWFRLGWLLELLAGASWKAVGKDVTSPKSTRNVDSLLPTLVFELFSPSELLGSLVIFQGIVVFLVVQVDLEGIVHSTSELAPRSSPV
jgi:hypothetical protein